MRVDNRYEDGRLVMAPTEWCIAPEDSETFFWRCVTITTQNITRFNVVIDLSSVELISINAIQRLLELRWSLERDGRSLSLTNVRPAVREFLCSLTVNDLICGHAGHLTAVLRNSPR